MASEILCDELEAAIGGNLHDVIKKNKASHENLKKHNRNNLDGKDDGIPVFKDLRVLKKLGQGEFGVVFLVGIYH